MTVSLHTAFSFLAAAALFAAPAAGQSTIYVDAGLATGANDGSTWADAFQGPLGLQSALAASASGDEVWVTGGTYHPVAPGGARTTSFSLRNGVTILGGFAGGETSAAARPGLGTFPSILSADNNDDDTANFGNQGDNAYHVIRTASTNSTAVIDGFTVTAGAAVANGSNNDRGGGILVTSGNSPTIRNCRFVGNRCTFGGGAGYVNGAPTFFRCSFEDNRGGSFGGAFDIANAGPISFDQCVFTGNQAVRAGALEIFATSTARVTNSFFRDNLATGSGGGGAMWFGSGGTTLVANCTVIENQSNSQAQGGISTSGATPRIVNCILWNNVGPNGNMNNFNQVTNGANVDHSLVMGGFVGGTGNISAAPSFVDDANGDYRLMAGSAGVDAGDSTALPADVLFDLAERGRFRDDPTAPDSGIPNGSIPVVDMGAFEFQAGAVGVGYCPNTGNSIGLPAGLEGSGSELVSDNDVTLRAFDLPPNQFGLLAVAQDSAMIPLAGGSQGSLCLGGAIGRYNSQVMNSGPSGSFSIMLNLNAIPTPTGSVAATAGDTWYFQVWYRDSIFGIPVSNFTSALRLDLR